MKLWFVSVIGNMRRRAWCPPRLVFALPAKRKLPALNNAFEPRAHRHPHPQGGDFLKYSSMVADTRRDPSTAPVYVHYPPSLERAGHIFFVFVFCSLRSAAPPRALDDEESNFLQGVEAQRLEARERKEQWEAEELRGFALARANQTGALSFLRT